MTFRYFSYFCRKCLRHVINRASKNAYTFRELSIGLAKSPRLTNICKKIFNKSNAAAVGSDYPKEVSPKIQIDFLNPTVWKPIHTPIRIKGFDSFILGDCKVTQWPQGFALRWTRTLYNLLAPAWQQIENNIFLQDMARYSVRKHSVIGWWISVIHAP